MNTNTNIAAEFLAPTKSHTGDCTEEDSERERARERAAERGLFFCRKRLCNR